jgi:hypothetical protein
MLIQIEKTNGILPIFYRLLTEISTSALLIKDELIGIGHELIDFQAQTQ